MILSTFLIAYGLAWGFKEIKILVFIPLFLPPLLLLLGVIMGVIPLLITNINSSRPFLYWRLFLFIYIVFLAFSNFIYLFLGLPINGIITGFIGLFIGIFMYFYTNKSLKHQFLGLSSSEGAVKDSDILGLFVRPQKVTEEEVSIAKEKQICLVCKNKLGGSIFLCSSCGAFYCSKCSDTLATLENACWVCEAPFDESKPVKKKEKIVEEVELEHKK